VTHLAQLSDLKAALNITSGAQDRALMLALDSASQAIEQWCGRQFTADTTATARLFEASSGWYCPVDDISTTTDLVIATDENDDGTYETVWSVSGYTLEPLNGRVDGQAWPYTRIRAVGDFLFPMTNLRPSVQVTACWGWPGGVPSAIEQACLIQASMVFKSLDAPFGVAGFGDIGALRLTRTLHPTAVMLADPYRVTSIGVG
jgi:uncharacterized protein (DUF427 family)